ncbi:MAG: transglutaminase domain-containing protein [Lachnospiraceae bacterium]|nr:transglutaminase domain-containing protein [Lachnospiraceae bacterium]
MDLSSIKTPEDVYVWIDENIQYGWLDREGHKHIDEMKNFRQLYRTMSLEEVFAYKMGTCIEQVALIHFLLDKIKIESKMFCCRIYEPDDYGNLEEEEHMHCFVLFYRNGKVYHLEHPNHEKKGIYEYETEKDAMRTIVDYYIQLRGGKESPTTQFMEVPEGISFKEFNAFINNQPEKT